MKKVFDQLEREGLAAGPWDYEIDALRVEEGMSLWEAQCHVITKWMVVGNFGPLLASKREWGIAWAGPDVAGPDAGDWRTNIQREGPWSSS